MSELKGLNRTLRALKKRPLQSFTIISLIALGIGMGSALFSISDALLLRPLPFDREGLLMDLQQQLEPSGSRLMNSNRNISEMRERSRSLEGIAAYKAAFGQITTNGLSEYAQGMTVDHYFFPLLSVDPILGRRFSSADEESDAAPTIILSYSFWRRHYAGDQSIVGKTILLDKTICTVIGVMPQSFTFPFSELAIPKEDFWLPLRVKEPSFSGDHDEYGLAKLKRGVSLEQSRAELASLSPTITEIGATGHERHSFTVVSFRQVIVADYIPLLALLTCIVVCVLVVMCINVASLLLLDVMRSRKEIEIRFAVGATRWRIAKVFLLRSMTLVGIGWLAGVFCAWWLVVIARKVLPTMVPGVDNIVLSLTVMWFAAGAALLTGIICGIWPAVAATLKLHVVALSGRRQATAGVLQRSRTYLVVLQLAFSTLFLAVTGLLGVSLYRLADVDPGFKLDHRVVVVMRPTGAILETTQELHTFILGVEDSLRSLPGVASTAVAFNAPLGAHSNRDFRIKDATPPKDLRDWMAEDNAVEANYFRELGIRITRGRSFTDEDGEIGAPVAIVNESFANRFFGTSAPLGRELCVPSGKQCQWREIVGIVTDVRDNNVDIRPAPTYFIPFAQAPLELSDTAAFILETSTPPGPMMPSIQRKMSALAPRAVSMGLFTLQDMRSRQMTPAFGRVLMLASVAFVALLLAAMGVYGIVAANVEQRKHEIGIRVALGATPQSIVALFTKGIFGMLIPGLLLGVVGTGFVARFISSALFGTSSVDPIAYTGAVFILAMVATIATLLPVRRALRASVAEVLRVD